MAAPWRRMGSPCLETEPWCVISAGGRVCLVKGVFGEEGYEVMVWDQCRVWTEKMEQKGVTERLKKLNPNIEAPFSLILTHLSSLLRSQSPTSSYTASTMLGGAGIKLSINTTLSNLPFTWEFCCKPAADDMLTKHLITPLLSMVKVLSHQNALLVSALQRKDKEIQDYKDHGATVSRRHLETAPFDDKAFLNEVTLSQEFEASARLPLDTVSSERFKELYRNVNMVRVWDQKKEDLPSALPPTTDATCDSTTGTWADKIPTSLLPTLSPTVPTSTSSPTHSPAKRPHTSSPSKDDEKSRREMLEKKLEEERARGKKKKKQLM